MKACVCATAKHVACIGDRFGNGGENVNVNMCECVCVWGVHETPCLQHAFGNHHRRSAFLTLKALSRSAPPQQQRNIE